METTSNIVMETTSDYFTVNKKKAKIVEGMSNSSVEGEEDVQEAGIDEAGRGCLVGRVYTE